MLCAAHEGYGVLLVQPLTHSLELSPSWHEAVRSWLGLGFDVYGFLVSSAGVLSNYLE